MTPDIAAKKTLKELRAAFAKAAGYERRGMLEEAARAYRFLLKKVPDPAAFYNLAVILKKLRDFDGALAHYEKAIGLKPDYAEAFVNIGSIHMEKREFARALEAYDKAVACAPMLVEALYNRGVVLQELRRHDEALADYDRVLILNPQYYLAYLNKSVILYELKRKTEAALNYERLLCCDPHQLDAQWNLGILRLSEGDFTSGWKLSEARLQLHDRLRGTLPQKPYWRGDEAIAGKTMFLRWEQGFGDAIQFCRYALLIKEAGANVILSVQEPLRRLIATLDPAIQVIGENEMPDEYDAHCLLMSLPFAFKTTIETIPRRARYLHADAAERFAFKTRMQAIAGLKIGLVWAGGLRQDITCARRNDANRSLALAQFLPLLALPHATFFSLQKGPPAAQLTPAHDITDWTEALDDFAATGAMIDNLDLVITVDTAVAHLAAALGKPVWILIPWTSCWRWLEDRTDSPWYETVRLFRQSERGTWDSVIEAVAQELRAKIANAKGGTNEGP